MTERTFAPWVEAFAKRSREDKRQVLASARSQPDEAWQKPSGLECWTCQDILAHIGRANDMMFQAILRRVIAGEHIEKAVFDVDTDGDNMRGVEKRRGMSPAGVIAEVEDTGEEIQDLLSQLTEEHEQYRQDDPPFILSGFVRSVERESHSIEHLNQLRAALGA